jgi:two-component system sensor histidine kinase BaeS
LAYSKALEDGIIEQNDYNKTFSILRIESLKLESYVKDIIDLAKYRARRFNIDPSYFLIEGIFNELNNVWLSKLEDLYPEENRLLSFPDFQDINIFSDRQRVLQILDLLIDNSFKAGSTITQLNSVATPSSIFLRVIDNGNGLSDEDLKLLFDDSAIYDKYRKEKRVGSGIGLALAKEIVDALQGNIHARHNSPQGAIFEIEIPLTYLVKDVQITDISPRITMGI